MAKVTRSHNESIERQISRFRRVVLRSGKLKQVRTSRYFQSKPSKIMMRAKAQYRTQKREEKIEG